MLKIKFCGGVGEVTGSNFLLTSENGEKLLIDVGLHQGFMQFEKNLRPFPYNPKEVKSLIITHAHLDHIGLIPKLVHDGFSQKIYSTQETKALSEIMLPDALKILKSDLAKRSLPAIYSESDIGKTFTLWDVKDYEEKFSPVLGLNVRFVNAGHILGSAMVEVENKNGERILFTGDIGNEPNILLPLAVIPENINVIVMESVYGDREHIDIQERRGELARIINETYKEKRTLIIPSFSVERTQIILNEIDTLLSENKISEMPVFLDSPLASKATAIYKDSVHRFKQEVKDVIKNGNDFLQFPRLKIVGDSFDSRGIENIKPPKIILAGSGMSEGGRVVGHEKTFLPHKDATILLVGYQSVGTLGRALQEGKKEVEIGGENIYVRAKIEMINGYSGHKDRNGLLEFVEKVSEKSAGKLKKIFVVMGEPRASMFIAQRIRDYLDIEAVVPSEGEEISL